MGISNFTGDITLDPSKFLSSEITENTIQINNVVEKATRSTVPWSVIGVQQYRDLAEQGKTPFPKPVYLPNAIDDTIPSRESGREIPLRIYKPDNGQPSRGILMHIHGGGFVLGSHRSIDARLKTYANVCQVTAMSVGYRHAPEDPYPAGPEDCFDAAEYLVDNGKKLFGSELSFIMGESAGGTLTVLTAFHLLRQRPDHILKGLLIPFGWFDLSLTLPKASSFDRPLLANTKSLRAFVNAYLPNWSVEQSMNPSVSPLYADLQTLALGSSNKSLPPALMLCGTEDPLLDDTLLMGMKWLATGSECVTKIYPGGCHGFTVMPGLKIAEDAQAVVLGWLEEKLTT